MKKTIVIAVMGLAASWCAAAGLSSEEAAAARKLYLGKCGRCHKFYNIDHYPDPAWEMWLGKMLVKSKLTPEQTGLLSRYLQTLRPSHPGTGTAANPPQP